MSRLRGLAPLSILLAATLLIGACVDGEDDASSPGGGEAAPEVVTVTLGNPDEFGVFLSPDSVAAGTWRFEVTNGGALLHEFVLLQFDGDPAAIPLDGNVVDRSAVEVLAEVEDLNPGESGSSDATLAPGTYVVLCDIPGHYIAGMWTLLTVD
jgi:uncharacterized cupredoxin-like copper-binding protein